jgi:zinc D-Ala-D-Ala carboxypeptidase
MSESFSSTFANVAIIEPATAKTSYQKNIMEKSNDIKMLTPHFSKWEMKRSGIAIRHNIANEPNAEQWKNLYNLCFNILEPLRLRFGAITITSGFRCKQLNDMVHGAINSQHCRGEAADIYIGSAEKATKYFQFIRLHTDFDQLIAEPAGRRIAEVRWIHVSFTTRRPNRHQIIAGTDQA